MQAPSEAAEWERLFWLVFERSSNPIALLDDQRRIINVNDPALALFGGDPADLLGSSMADSIRPAERPVAETEWEEFLSSGDYAGTTDLIRADGSEVRVDFAARLAVLGGRRLAIYVSVPKEETSSPPLLTLPAEHSLTTREREVVTLIALGRDTAQIAEQLHISPETVRTHVRNAMSKLGARTRAQLVAIALSSGQTMQASQLEH